MRSPRNFPVLLSFFSLASCVASLPREAAPARRAAPFDERVRFERLVPAPKGIQRPEGDVWAMADRIEPVSLRDLLEGSRTAPISVLVFFGGADGLSAQLWCGDSEKEIELWTALRKRMNPFQVQIIGVACPPVYGSGGYGDGRAVFFDADESSPGFISARANFIQRTRSQMRVAGEPFDQLVFDLHLRALLNRTKEMPRAREVESWEGSFKASGDLQSYGTPTVWILARDGTPVCEPFWGNNYPDRIRYQYEDVAQAIERALEALASRR